MQRAAHRVPPLQPHLQVVVFASGSPFPPFTTHDERTLFPAQANNAYVFPPIGMAALLTHCSTISDAVFLEAAESLARATPASRLSAGMLFPAFSDMKVRHALPCVLR